MAVKMDNDVTTPASTGAAEFDGSSVTTEQPADNTSTGAVEYVAPGETSVDHHGADAVVRSQTPSEPVTMTVSWKPEAKVVTPAESKPPARKTSTAKTKG